MAFCRSLPRELLRRARGRTRERVATTLACSLTWRSAWAATDLTSLRHASSCRRDGASDNRRKLVSDPRHPFVSARGRGRQLRERRDLAEQRRDRERIGGDGLEFQRPVLALSSRLRRV